MSPSAQTPPITEQTQTPAHPRVQFSNSTIDIASSSTQATPISEQPFPARSRVRSSNSNTDIRATVTPSTLPSPNSEQPQPPVRSRPSPARLRSSNSNTGIDYLRGSNVPQDAYLPVATTLSNDPVYADVISIEAATNLPVAVVSIYESV